MSLLKPKHRSSNRHLDSSKHQPDSTVRETKVGHGSQNNPTEETSQFIQSWLTQARPHRHRPPDSKCDERPSDRHGERKRKRAGSPPDHPVSVSPENRRIVFRNYEKRPRHKTREDKYEYKQGPSQRRRPQEKRPKRSDGERELESHSKRSPVARNSRKHRSDTKKRAQRVSVSGYESKALGVSPSPDKRLSKPRKSRGKTTRDEKDNRELEEASKFFSRGASEENSSYQIKYRSKTRPKRHSPSRSWKRGASIDVLDELKQKFRHIDSQQPENTHSHTNDDDTHFRSKSTSYFTWSTSKGIRNGDGGPNSSSSGPRERPTRPRQVRESGLTKSRENHERETRAITTRGNYVDSGSQTYFEARPDHTIQSPPEMQQQSGGRALEFRDSQQVNDQKPVLDDRYMRLNKIRASEVWPRSTAEAELRQRYQALPQNEPRFSDGGGRGNFELLTKRLLDHTPGLSSVDIRGFPRTASSDLRPTFEGPPYATTQRPFTPGNYGAIPIEVAQESLDVYTIPRSQSVIQHTTEPLAAYRLDQEANSFYRDPPAQFPPDIGRNSMPGMPDWHGGRTDQETFANQKPILHSGRFTYGDYDPPIEATGRRPRESPSHAAQEAISSWSVRNSQ
ncbi:hypothetical protein B0H66DRAFT_527704 [Apodospora peruviana]|uniref:Uncharacterized protein n=1 Tax=Apodospora peruviana TaxID=516989 RepID=A0AAE0MG06_9PEZI|nr:hypothetical protein B0H66DRAFT_527704 [Apodospora peruviana]